MPWGATPTQWPSQRVCSPLTWHQRAYYWKTNVKNQTARVGLERKLINRHFWPKEPTKWVSAELGIGLSCGGGLKSFLIMVNAFILLSYSPSRRPQKKWVKVLANRTIPHQLSPHSVLKETFPCSWLFYNTSLAFVCIWSPPHLKDYYEDLAAITVETEVEGLLILKYHLSEWFWCAVARVFLMQTHGALSRGWNHEKAQP